MVILLVTIACGAPATGEFSFLPLVNVTQTAAEFSSLSAESKLCCYCLLLVACVINYKITIVIRINNNYVHYKQHMHVLYLFDASIGS